MAMEFEETVNLFNNIGLVYDKLGDKKQTAALVQESPGPQGRKLDDLKMF